MINAKRYPGGEALTPLCCDDLRASVHWWFSTLAIAVSTNQTHSAASDWLSFAHLATPKQLIQNREKKFHRSINKETLKAKVPTKPLTNQSTHEWVK